MRRIKKLMLLTALCAIISCSGGGGGGVTADNSPTPTNPSNPGNTVVPGNPSLPGYSEKPGDPSNKYRPVLPNGKVFSRYTETNLENMLVKDSLPNMKVSPATDITNVQKGEVAYRMLLKPYYIERDWVDPTVWADIKANYSDLSPVLEPEEPWPDPTVPMTVRTGGIAIQAEGLEDINFMDISNNESTLHHKLNRAVKNLMVAFGEGLSDLHKVILEDDATFIAFTQQELPLSKSRYVYQTLHLDLSHIVGLNVEVGGKGQIFKFKDSVLHIDKNVQLEDATNEYNSIMKKMINPKFIIDSGVKIEGRTHNQIGARAIGRVSPGGVIDKGRGIKSVNNGEIEIKGDNTIGIFVRDSTASNNGKISVMKNSSGMYAIYDEANYGDGELQIINENSGNIKIGENSVGMHVYRKNYNTSRQAVNFGTIEGDDKFSDNAAGMVIDVGGEEFILKNPPYPPRMIVMDATRRKFENAFGNLDLKYAGINSGIINLTNDRPTGMYLTGEGEAYITNGFRDTSGKIIIGDSKDKTYPGIGMYSDNKKGTLINTEKGTIEIGKNSIGMGGVNGTTVKNEGTIIIKGDNSVGMYLADGSKGFNSGVIKTLGATKNVYGVVLGDGSEFTNTGTITISSENGAGIVIAGGTVINKGTIKVSGGAVEQMSAPTKSVVKALSDRSVKKDMKVYVDSLGETNPIEGLSNLGFKNAELSIGAEATEKTNATEVTVAGNVLDPFNKSIHESNIGSWSVGSGSLVWEAEPEIKDNNIEKVTLKKQSYAKYADEKTEEVAKALDEKYVNTGANTKDKQIFNDMNKLNSGKELAKTYKEVSGGQYINVQQRINQTDEVLEKEITALRNDKLTEAGHHITTFVGKDNYEAKTPEIAKSKSVNYGAAYLYNDTNNGWGAYAGAVMNKFKLEDEGKSKENMTLVKAGAYKTLDLGPVDWTVGGEGNISWNEIKRRYVSLGTVYENKADYNSYGLAVKNELSKTYQLNDMFTFKPYGALKIGFGKFTDIKEKNSTLGLEVKGNSYYSVKPALGMELGLAVPVGTSAKFKAGLGLGYEHELGKIENNENEAKFINVGTSWKLKGAKDEDRGGLKSELKAGFEAGNYNIYLTGGYNTKGKNSHVGIKFGASF